MGSRMEIDFMDLNSRPQYAEMAKQHNKASGLKWPFSLADITSQYGETFFQNYNSCPIVSRSSKGSHLNNTMANYNLATKESQYIVAKATTSDPRQSMQTETLTIFYSGGVHIFQNITPEKAELILEMASKSTATLNMNEILEVNKEKTEVNKSEPSKINESINYAKGALAMARRATLARFLEKRKHRLIKVGPYETAPKFAFDMHQEETASSSVHWES